MKRLDFVCLDCLPNIELNRSLLGWNFTTVVSWLFSEALANFVYNWYNIDVRAIVWLKNYRYPKYYSCTELVLGSNQYIACPEQWRVATCHETNEQQCRETKALSCVKQKGLSFCLDWYIACTHGGLRGILTCFLYMSTHITYQHQQRSYIQYSLISTKLNRTACLHNPLGSHSSNVFFFFHSFIYLFYVKFIFIIISIKLQSAG